MAGLWSVKFDHKNGELRKCRLCDAEFHAKKPSWRCNQCVNAAQKLIEGKKRSKYERKDPYPYQGPNHDYHSRFYPLRSKLHKMKVRVEWQTYFKERMDEILNDEVLMKWINDRRDKETAEAKQVKSKKNIQRDYPNTHDYYEY
jgi:hypothetical protein